MKAKKEALEISIEEWVIETDHITIEYFQHNDFKVFRCPLIKLEAYVTDHELLEWTDIKILVDGSFEERDGVWEFSEYVKDKLDAHTVKKFLIYELEKMKA